MVHVRDDPSDHRGKGTRTGANDESKHQHRREGIRGGTPDLPDEEHQRRPDEHRPPAIDLAERRKEHRRARKAQRPHGDADAECQGRQAPFLALGLRCDRVRASAVRCGERAPAADDEDDVLA